MENTELREKWPGLKVKIAQQHPELSREDLILELGRESELLLRLQEKLGKNKKEIENWLSMMG